MNPNQALAQLKASIDQHGLVGWSASLDTAVNRFGLCSPGKKHISLSRKLCELNSDEEVTDTILHEIAHALASERHGENCGHDERWKKICIEIGARPETCYDTTVVQPDAPWLLVHKTTGEVFRSYHKKPNRDWSRVWARGRKEETLGQMVIRSRDDITASAANTVNNSANQILSFTPQSVLQVQEELIAMVKTYAKQHGLELRGAKCKYSSQTSDFTISLAVPSGIDATENERLEFEVLAPMFDLTAADYRRSFQLNGKRFQLVALKPNNRKYPIIGSDEAGRQYKFTLDVIDQFQNA